MTEVMAIVVEAADGYEGPPQNNKQNNKHLDSAPNSFRGVHFRETLSMMVSLMVSSYMFLEALKVEVSERVAVK